MATITRKKNPHAIALGRLGGAASGPGKMRLLSPERRREIAMLGVAALLKKRDEKKSREENVAAKEKQPTQHG